MKRLVLILWFLASCFISFSQLKSEDEVWAFSYFKGNGEDGLHLAYSEDGFTWHALRKDSSFLKPEIGNEKLMRDPCIIKGPDGKFHMVWTVSWKDKGIGYANSPDLMHWSEQVFVPVMAHEPNARNCWAPEIIYDDRSKTYMIYWSTTISGRFPATDTLGDHDHRIYYTTTKDFKKFSESKLLYNEGFNVIDATIVKDSTRYIMFLKDETLKPVAQKNLRVAISKSLNGGYSKPSTPITGDYWAEGPTVIKSGGKWIVYFDKYRQHAYGAVRSGDLENWEDVSEKISFPSGTRHGTAFTISRQLLKLLK
jgi:beta-xylosidase